MTNTKKTLITLPLIILSFVGVLVNLIYYINSFNNSGYGSLLAVLMSVCFLGLEYVLYLYNIKILSNRWLKALKVLIISFSIVITMSAQFFSTSVNEVISNKAVNKSAIYLQQIEDNRAEKLKKEKLLETYSLQDNSKSARQDTEARIEFLSNDNIRLYALLLSKDTITEKPKNSYTYYADKIPGVEPEDVRIIFQFISSFILAILAPVALTIMKHVRSSESSVTVKPEPIQPEKIPEVVKDPKIKNSVIQVLILLLFTFDENKEIMEPQEAFVRFNKLLKNKRPNVIPHTLEEITEVYNLIIKNKIKGKTADTIRQGVLNEY